MNTSDILIEKMGDLRQSEEWAKYLASQGWEVEELHVTGYSEAEAKEEGSCRRQGSYKLRVYIKKLPLIGSVIKIQRPDVIPPIEAIDEIAKKHRALFVRFEPLSTVNCEQLTDRCFVPDPAPCLPTKTIVVDLKKSEKELWKNLSENARRNIKKAISYKLLAISYQGNDEKFNEALKEFHRLLKATGRARGFWPPTFGELKAKADAFGPNALLFLACPNPHSPILQSSDSQKAPLLAGFFLLLHDETVYYEYAASSDLGRKLNAPYLIVWEAVRAISHKPLAISQLDFTSIYDPRFHKATKRWKGFTEFKKRWGGQEVEYPQPLIKCYRPLGKLFHLLDKLQFG